MLIFIYYYKNLLSIGDIKTLMTPLNEKYFNSSSGLNLTDIYEELFSLEKSQLEVLQNNAASIFETASQTFTDAPEEDRELLRRFAFISLLGFDVYLKKQMIGCLIDEMAASQLDAHPAPTKKASKKASRDKD